MSEELINIERGELIIPQIDVGDITALEGIANGIDEEKTRIEGNSEYSKKLKEFLEGVRKKKKLRIVRDSWTGIKEISLFGKEFYVIEPSDLEKFESFKKEIDNEYFPSIIEKLSYTEPFDEVFKDLRIIGDKTQVFLKYFFPTSINEFIEAKEWEKIIPATEKTSVLFSLYNEERVVPFKSTGKSLTKGEIENMQLIGSVLPDKATDFFIGEIKKAVVKYNKSLEGTVEKLAPFNRTRVKPNEELEMDVELFNGYLSRLHEPYTPQTGIYAVSLEIARRRIYNQLGKDIKKAGKSAKSFLRIRSNLEELGYRTINPSKGETYAYLFS